MKITTYWHDFAKAAQRSPLNLQEAIALFNSLADIHEVAFEFPQNGCAQRAHLMCRAMLAKGHLPGKAWIFQQDDMLSLTAPNGEEIYWCYHVAPTLPVHLPDGTTDILVLDPGLFDGPVRRAQWAQVMGAAADRVHTVALGKSPPNKFGDYMPYDKRIDGWIYGRTKSTTDQDSLRLMNKYKWMRRGDRRKVFASGLRASHDISTWMSERPWGKTWQTAKKSYFEMMQNTGGFLENFKHPSAPASAIAVEAAGVSI